MEDHRFLPAPGARVGLLGGTFNPVHAGHIRHALEVGEALNLERVLLTPAAVPPHKAAAGLLPFALRVELARAAARGASRLGVNTLEGELDGPSYTFVSLRAWRERHPGVTPFFLMGVEDFAALRSWHRGLELPGLARLVVVPGPDRIAGFSTPRWNATGREPRPEPSARTAPAGKACVCRTAESAIFCPCPGWTSARPLCASAGWPGATSAPWCRTECWT